MALFLFLLITLLVLSKFGMKENVPRRAFSSHSLPHSAGHATVLLLSSRSQDSQGQDVELQLELDSVDDKE